MSIKSILLEKYPKEIIFSIEMKFLKWKNFLESLDPFALEVCSHDLNLAVQNGNDTYAGILSDACGCMPNETVHKFPLGVYIYKNIYGTNPFLRWDLAFVFLLRKRSEEFWSN